MHWLRSKRFWLSVAHLGVIGGGAAAVLLFPPAAVLIAPGAGLINALIPSPVSKP